MSVEVLPLGVRCNIACTYCYQEPMRPGDKARPYSMEKMLASVDEELKNHKHKTFQVFGGEPLLVPIADLEALLRASFERGGSSGIQTNASLITQEHIDLFKRYKTHVGVSIDGPGDLNDARWAGSFERTRQTTQKSLSAIDQLSVQEVPFSVILTLTKANASPDKLEILIEWLGSLAKKGLRDARIHLLEVDSLRAEALRLTEDEAFLALLRLHRAEPFIGVKFDVFMDMLALLRGKDEEATCIWNGCDPWTTSAVRGVGPNGEHLNCGRTNKTPINWIKANSSSQRRQLILYSTPYEDGGCKDCRFFVACKGQCPGEAIDGDFRNRSSNCRIWFRMFEVLEAHLVAVRDFPVSMRPDLSKIEAAMLNEWAQNRFVSVKRGIELATNPQAARTGTTETHGDIPHGDSHGDHYDTSRT